MTADQALPEEVPSPTELIAARARARRLLLISRGIYILMAGVFLGLLGALKIAQVAERIVTDLGIPIAITALLLASIAVQRWRRARGIGMTTPSDLAGQRPGTPDFRRAMNVLVCLFILGIAVGLSAAWLPERVFHYATVTWAVGLAVFLSWRWRSAHAWETWLLGGGLAAMGLVVVAVGLERGLGPGLLVVGISSAAAGVSLELKWINWVRTTSGLVAPSSQGQVQP